MRRQLSLSSGLRADLAISSHSAACFRNSSGGLRGIMHSFSFFDARSPLLEYTRSRREQAGSREDVLEIKSQRSRSAGSCKQSKNIAPAIGAERSISFESSRKVSRFPYHLKGCEQGRIVKGF